MHRIAASLPVGYWNILALEVQHLGVPQFAAAGERVRVDLDAEPRLVRHVARPRSKDQPAIDDAVSKLLICLGRGDVANDRLRSVTSSAFSAGCNLADDRTEMVDTVDEVELIFSPSYPSHVGDACLANYVDLLAVIEG